MLGGILAGFCILALLSRIVENISNRLNNRKVGESRSRFKAREQERKSGVQSILASPISKFR
jgi:hypothetical protein